MSLLPISNRRAISRHERRLRRFRNRHEELIELRRQRLQYMIINGWDVLEPEWEPREKVNWIKEGF